MTAIGTYAAAVAVCGASLAIGQAAIALCGVRRWSWLAPAVGLALVTAVCWATVRLPGDGAVAAILVPLLVLGSVACLRGRLEGRGEALRAGWPVALGALAAASLPFAVEGHFGILGTGFNPDMSQHLLATDRLAEGHGSQLLREGYPLGPHAVVVALHRGLGIGLVQGFGGLTVAAAVIAPLTALAAFRDVPPVPRAAAALVVGLAYLVASYFAQGAFKETMQALFLLAFVLGLREATGSWRDLPLRFVPSALIAAGAIYVYSFPALIWFGGAAVLWALGEAARRRGAPSARGPAELRSVLLAVLAFAVLAAPEVGRMVDFQQFETFDPNGPGLGNLFGQISPFEALGIWPSGDFRLAPGDGAVPAFAYYLGIALALLMLVYGIACCRRRRETAILAGLAAAACVYVAARVGGTPYTAAKAIEVGAPLVALTILSALLPGSNAVSPAQRGRLHASRVGRGIWGGRRGWSAASPAIAAFVLAAGGCSLLALANAPVGPSSYSPALTSMRPIVADDSTLVIASDRLLAHEHGSSYISWELRGGRVCVASESEAGRAPPVGVRFVVTEGDPSQPPYSGLRIRRVAVPYVLWEVRGRIAAGTPCPLIAVRQARQGPAR